MSILKRKVNSSSIFVSFFIVTTYNSSVNFKLIHFLLWTKGSHQSPNFDIFKCSGQNLSNCSCQFSNDKLIPLQILYHYSVSWQTTPLYFFSSNNIYFAQKEPNKGQHFWDFQELKSKFVKFLLSILKLQVDSSPNFVYFAVSWKITPLYFFSSNNIYSAQKEQIKVKIFETFKCSGQNSSNSPCQFWIDKSMPLQILHHSSLSWHIITLL